MNNKTSGRILLNPAIVIAVLFILATLGYAQSPGPETEQQRDERMKWWREARFGMFICWGPVSLTGKEVGWSRGAPPGAKRAGMKGGRGPTPVEVYDNLYKKWKPDKFDARQWAQVAKESGMKYIIFLVKHHDGFCLYDSKLTDYKSTGRESAWKVDVMKEIADACHEVGLKLFIYYSQPDWHHPDYLTENHDRYIRYLHGQIRELLTDYGRIDGLWFDNLRPVKPETAKLWDAENLFKMARSIQPHLIINNRCGLPGDFDTPEQRIGRLQVERPWESCITLGTQWAWKPDDQIKSLKECIDILVTCAGRGGNLALNTNPMPDGRIEPRQVKRFHEIGRWMKKYGESIYGTTASPFEKLSWGRCTAKPGKLYLHVLDWPKNGELEVPISTNKVKRAYLLAYEQRGDLLLGGEDRDNLVITIPRKAPDPVNTVVVLEIEGVAAVTRYPLEQAKDGAITLKAVDAKVHGTSTRYESGGGKDNIGYWTNPNDYVTWAFEVTTPGTFNVEVSLACANGVGGSEYVLAVGEQELAGTVKDTGGWTSFVTEKLGTVKLTKAGTYTLSVKPKTMPRSAVMNLKSVTLVPIKK